MCGADSDCEPTVVLTGLPPAPPPRGRPLIPLCEGAPAPAREGEPDPEWSEDELRGLAYLIRWCYELPALIALAVLLC